MQRPKTYDYHYETYSPAAGQAFYETHRQHCGRRPKWALSDAFADWADTQMLDHHWSPNAVVGAAKTMDVFSGVIIPSTTTLYDWIDCGIMRTKKSIYPRKWASDKVQVRPSAGT